jgi:hypothetical protein
MQDDKNTGFKIGNRQTLLRRAEKQFLKSNYINALKIYSLLLKDYPQMEDARIGAYLSDIGLESDEDAQALFDYYHILKSVRDNPENIIDELIETIDGTKFIIEELFRDAFDSVDDEVGIGYRDFLNLVEIKGSFKRAFEDTLFSTKVVIRNKREFVGFITKLIDAGYRDTALTYLDTLAESFGKDQEVYNLYNLIQDVGK